MKRTIYTAFFAALTGMILLSACGGPKRKPGRTYMPDMAYSRAVESYPDLDTSIFTQNEQAAGNKIYYDRKPAAGAVKRGQIMVYYGTNDSLGIKASATVVNPLPDTSMSKTDMSEAERLYNIYCGICHGPKLDGKGPISNKWAGAPANLVADKYAKSVYPDGQIFHTITYGIRQMGGYASQLDVKQRWMIVNFIRSKQNAVAKKPAAGADTSKAAVPATPKP